MKQTRSGNGRTPRTTARNDAKGVAAAGPVGASAEGIERWLRMKPPEMGAVLAVRAALRAIPALDTLEVNLQPIALQTFRASAIGFVACRYPAHRAALGQNAISAANNIFNAANAADRLRAFATATVARAAGHAALAAVDSAFTRTLSAPKAIDAIKGATDVAIASVFDGDPFDSSHPPTARISSTIAATIADIESLDTHASPSELATGLLWPNGSPAWASQAWERLANALYSGMSDWDVWTNWYEARLRGQGGSESVELARAMIGDDLWSRGPAITNAHIKRLSRREDPLDVNDDESLEEWLNEKPREWGIVLAARAALRVLPFDPQEVTKPYAANLLSAFRASAASRYAAEYPDRESPAVLAAEALSNEGLRRPISSSLIASGAASAVYAADSTEVVRIIGLANDFVVMQDEILRDAQDLQHGMSPQQLARAPLWPSGMVDNVRPDLVPQLVRFSQNLRRLGNHWEVWINWYEYVIKGTPPGSERNEAWETAFVDLPEPLPWGQGAEIVNTRIAERLRGEPEAPRDSSSPTIPPQRPAAIEPVWNRGILTLSKKPAKTDLSGRKFTAALKALQADLRAFADDISREANIDKRFVSYVRTLSERIPKTSPRQDDLFRMGHAEDVFAAYAKTVDREWPEILAARYHALVLNFDRAMRQSALWRTFKRNAAQQTLTPQQIAVAPQLAAELARALRDSEAQDFVDPMVPESLDKLVAAEPAPGGEYEAPMDAITAGKELLAIDVIESINNILKRLAEKTIAMTTVVSRSMKDYVGGLAKELPKASAKLGHEHGSKLPKWLFRLATGGPVIGYIVSHFSQTFAWFVEHVLPLLPK